ncbi:MAG: hypothetical protein WCP20_23345 [Desulfuromonadales bacterium]
MDLYRINSITDEDDVQAIRVHSTCIMGKCLSIFDRHRSPYYIDRYLRRLLDGDSYLKLDIIEDNLRPIINKRYFSFPAEDEMLLEALQARGRNY